MLQIEPSQTESCRHNHLLRYKSDYTNVKDWMYLGLNTLYWALARRWPHLGEAVEEHSGTMAQDENVQIRGQGFRLSPFEAYPHRGPVLAKLCFYDYLLCQAGKGGEPGFEIGKRQQECAVRGGVGLM